MEDGFGTGAATEPATAQSGPALSLPSFSGPLDLLLHLIQKDEVSIWDIQIASICDQYYEHLSEMQQLDLEIAAEFLWMASWLLHLKSRELLPKRRSEHVEEEDPREMLVERLLEYRRVKELASVLYEIDVVRRCVWVAHVSADLGEPEHDVDWEDVDLRRLAAGYLEAMQRFAAMHPPPIRVIPLRYTVKEKMREVYDRVTGEGIFPLLRYLHTRPEPEEVVTVVVAVLELTRIGGVCTDQSRPFAEIYLRPGPTPLADDHVS